MAKSRSAEISLKDLQDSIKAQLSPMLSSIDLVSFPSSGEFQSSNLRFTEYERPTYIAAVRPQCEQDVVQTVKYAKSRGIPLVARSGHHCVTTTMKGLQNGIVLDMRSINNMQFDAQRLQVTVGGGVLADDFTKYLYGLGMEVSKSSEHLCQESCEGALLFRTAVHVFHLSLNVLADFHHRDIAVGSCPTTGIIGVSFGAGLGRLQGKYGYLSDNMISCRMVLADGSTVTVSQESHPDLFWAIRGAGHNFGIALEATFRVYPQTNQGIHHTWDFEYRLEKCEEIFELLNHVHEIMPPELAIFVLWRRESSSGEKNLILVNLVYHGPDAESRKWIIQFEDLGPVGPSGKVSTTWPELPWETYGGQNKLLSKPEVWKLAPYKVMAAVNVQKFHPPTLRAFFESVKEMNIRYAGRGVLGAMFECLPHHRTKEIANDTTAFPWRHGGEHQLMMTATPRSSADLEAFEEHLEKWKDAFIRVSGYGRLHQYVNYGNTTSKHDPVEALYGYEPWRLRKLRGLKRKYDPEGFFSWYQPFM